MLKLFLSKPTTCILTAITLASCSGSMSPDQQVQGHKTIEAKEIIAPWQSNDAPGVAVAISLNDKIIFSEGAGLASLEHRQKIVPDSVFQIASVSKQFTAFATLLLVSEGKISLDEDIRHYFPELSETPRVITVRHLLDHMSGLRERNTLAAMAGWMEDDIQTEAQLTELVVRQRGVNFTAGEKVEYSNTGYALLAAIVARQSGQSFQDFMRERVFQPLDMTQTTIPNNRNDIIPARASSYYPEGDGYKNIIAAGEAMGSTGIYTSTLDLLKWAENFETKVVGDKFVFDMMEERSIAANGKASTFAKGQELRPYKGLQTWSHGGRDAGYRSFVLRIPNEDFELSILSNRTDFDTAKMAFALVDTFLGDTVNYQNDIPEEFNVTTKTDLAAYEGDYEFFPGTIFSIRATDQGLTFAAFGATRDSLEPLSQIGQRQFMLNPRQDISIKFAPPTGGKSANFEYQIGLHGSINADRIELQAFEQEGVEHTEYVGVFTSQELETRYSLTSKDGQLYAKHARLPVFELSPLQEDQFTGLNGPLQKVEFIRENGEIVGFYASAPLSERIKFVRQE